MKTAIYIEDGITQVVLTPESDWEKSALRAIDRESSSVVTLRGSFYECKGGWIRNSLSSYQVESDESLIVLLRSASKQPNIPVGINT